MCATSATLSWSHPFYNDNFIENLKTYVCNVCSDSMFIPNSQVMPNFAVLRVVARPRFVYFSLCNNSKIYQ